VFTGPDRDGSCRAVREAMAAGLPVLARPRGFVTDLIHDGESGLWVDMNAPAVADALERLIGDPRLRERLGGRARAVARERFNREVQARKVLGFYEQLRQRRGARED